MQTYSARDRRVKPTTPRPFGAGLLPYEPASRIPVERPTDRSALPAIDGSGLAKAEWFRVNGARNRATHAYAADCPDASSSEINRVGRAAATDELRRLLRDRPAAPEPVKPAILPTRTDLPRPAHTPADERWWAENQPAPLMPVCGGAPEPEPAPECGVSGAWFCPGEYEDLSDLEPAFRELSDDASGAFLGHSE